VQRRRAFEEILQQFEEAIAASVLEPGSRLPPERELADQFGVSRTSVREALRVLESLGLVRTRPGADNGAVLLKEPGNSFAYLFRFYLALKHIDVGSVVHSHAMVEAWAADVAAANTPVDLVSQLSAIVSQMKLADTDQWSFHLLDLEFHSSIVRSSGNELGMLFFEGCQNSIERSILRELSDAGDWHTVRGQLIKEHSGILEAITKGDRQASRALVTDHILKWARLASLIDIDNVKSVH
jgi:GntR family transcriptional repressor for pyruvate dehydrogenase complex